MIMANQCVATTEALIQIHGWSANLARLNEELSSMSHGDEFCNVSFLPQ